MRRVYIAPGFPKAVTRVFEDVLHLSDCEAAQHPEQAELHILNHMTDLPTEGGTRTLIVHDGTGPLVPTNAHCTILRAPFRLSRLMMELHQPRAMPLPPLADGWEAEPGSRSFTHAEHASIALTEREWDMCLYLLRQKDVVSPERLLQDLWGYEPNVESHTVETHIYRLRQKLEQHARPPCHITTSEGGYKAGI
jgi:hypothetical protein